MVAVDGSERLGDALDRLYAEHHLPPDGGARDAWFHVRLGPLRVPLPNPPARQRAVLIHDINHVLTGYNATFSDGEMSIAAYEVGTGCGRVWVAWALNLPLMALGAIVRPRRVFLAFARGREARSLYDDSVDRAALQTMSVDAVRRMIDLDAGPLAPRPMDFGRYVLWVGSTWIVIVGTPVLLGAAAWRLIT
jgi:hypothetical protein